MDLHTNEIGLGRSCFRCDVSNGQSKWADPPLLICIIGRLVGSIYWWQSTYMDDYMSVQLARVIQ